MSARDQERLQRWLDAGGRDGARADETAWADDACAVDAELDESSVVKSDSNG